MTRSTLIATTLIVATATPTFATENTAESTRGQATPIAVRAASPAQPQPLIVPAWISETRRPVVLPALYVSLGVLNGLDLYTTSQALQAGAREANPVVGPLATRSAAGIALKAATTATTIYLAERLWKKNRGAAVATMLVVNGATAAIVAHNAQNARRR